MTDNSHSINLTRMWKIPNADAPGSLDCRFGNDAAEPNRWIDLTNLPNQCFTGQFPLIRSFNCPTGLQPDSRCELVFDNLPVGAICHLNERRLGIIDESRSRFVITPLLRVTNLILLELPQLCGSATDSASTVWLEIL